MRSRVGRGSGAISAAPATRESAPTLLCKNATEETHTTARLECVVVVGKIADFADDDDIFFFFFAFYERVSKGATSSVDRDGSRGEEVFFAAKNHKEWWCPSFLKSRRRLPPPRVSKVKRVKCVRGKILDREEYTEHISFFIFFCTLTRFVSSSLQKVDAVAREREERERERR